MRPFQNVASVKIIPIEEVVHNYDSKLLLL